MCTNKYCYDQGTRRERGKGSFKGYVLYICNHCGQIVKMFKVDS